MATFIALSSVLLFFALVFLRASSRAKRLVESPFACPNCGHRFTVKWNHMLFSSNFMSISLLKPGLYSLHSESPQVLTCPKCKVKDACKRPYDNAQ